MTDRDSQRKRRKTGGSKMSSGQEDAPWDNFLSDFTLILDTGEKLKCHKIILAESSSVMKTMMTTDMTEARTNEMKLQGFDMETVTHFLEYLYAKDVTKTIGGKNIILAKDYDEAKLTPKLLRLAHMYELEALVAACIDNLKKNQNPDLAFEILKAAEELSIDELKQSTYRCFATHVSQDVGIVMTCGHCKRTEAPILYCSCGYETSFRDEYKKWMCYNNQKSKVSFNFPPPE